MDVTNLDVAELRRRMRLASDVVIAHRIARGLSLDRERVTRLRDVMEERVVRALEETDASQMPEGWSWERAVESLSIQVALAIVQEQKTEPPAETG